MKEQDKIIEALSQLQKEVFGLALLSDGYYLITDETVNTFEVVLLTPFAGIFITTINKEGINYVKFKNKSNLSKVKSGEEVLQLKDYIETLKEQKQQKDIKE